MFLSSATKSYHGQLSVQAVHNVPDAEPGHLTFDTAQEVDAPHSTLPKVLRPGKAGETCNNVEAKLETQRNAKAVEAVALPPQTHP